MPTSQQHHQHHQHHQHQCVTQCWTSALTLELEEAPVVFRLLIRHLLPGLSQSGIRCIDVTIRHHGDKRGEKDRRAHSSSVARTAEEGVKEKARTIQARSHQRSAEQETQMRQIRVTGWRLSSGCEEVGMLLSLVVCDNNVASCANLLCSSCLLLLLLLLLLR
jgi:hypothetical protein